MKNFSLSEIQIKKIKEWQDSRNPLLYCGAVGGRWTYMFTPTSLGYIVNVKDNLLNENNILDVSEYEDF